MKQKNGLVLIPKYSSSHQKRAFDLLVGTSLLLCSIPAMAIIGLAIFITSGKPIIFSQQRLGKNKQVFTVYKFRTMRVGADNKQKQLSKLNIAPAPMFKLEKDPRFTSIGYYLSRTGIDELPQLINILKNDMSLVGPRPLPIAEGTALMHDWDWRWRVKPGLFSYWVLSPHRYENLETWKQLEKKTVQMASFIEDFFVIQKIIKQQIRALRAYLPNILQ